MWQRSWALGASEAIVGTFSGRLVRRAAPWHGEQCLVDRVPVSLKTGGSRYPLCEPWLPPTGLFPCSPQRSAPVSGKKSWKEGTCSGCIDGLG